MLGTNELLSLYKAEKADLSDPLSDDSFPSFAQWREAYEADARNNYQTVTVDEADKLMDSLVTEALGTLEPAAEDAHIDSQPSEERTMNIVAEENKQPETAESTEVTTTAETKPARKRKAKTAAAAKNKTAQARAIFKSLNRGKAGPDRQKVLKRFMEEVGLSKAGASTYYQKFKTEFAAAAKKAS